MATLNIRSDFALTARPRPGRHSPSALRTDNVLVRRLAHFAPLSSEEQALLCEISRERVRVVAPRTDLMREGEPPPAVHLLLSGWACRYKALEDGRRQIVGLLLPGDLCDVNNSVLRAIDHSVAAITEVVVAQIAHERLERIGAAHSRIARAICWDMLVAAAIQREWIVNLGQRSAIERIGHLFCEMFLRLRAVGLTRGASCDMPITQIELAEAMGITPVHVNRTLQEMRSQQLIILKDRVLTVPDLAALQRSLFFSADYLHLDEESEPANTADIRIPAAG